MRNVGYFSLIFLVFFLSCTKDEFNANKMVDTNSSGRVITYSSSKCSNFTLVKAKVDYLFLWDNSSSQLFINDQTKQALNNTIDLISDKFNYHVILAPLLDSGNDNVYLLSENPDGLNLSNPDIQRMLIPQGEAAAKLGTFPIGLGSTEQGMERTISLISQNHGNGLFRSNAHLIVVLMSNGDDVKKDGRGQFSGPLTDIYISEKKAQLISLRNNTLNSQQFRFMSIVAHTACHTGYTASYTYKKMSKLMYEEPYTGGIPSPTDQAGKDWPDSYDICGTDFVHLFDGINNSIQQTIEKHVYDYWPIAADGAVFDKDKVIVFKSTGQEVLPKGGSSNGFVVLDGVQTKDTRVYPTRGEPYTGFLLQLFGNSRVTYPECLIVNTQSPAEYYGYVHLHANPVLSSITLTINGSVIPQSTSNGWEFIGYKDSQNLKIKSPTDYTPATPPLNKTGYFLKLHGNAVYSNNSSIEVIYDPSS